MNKYAGWQAVYMSFFSGDLYRDVARNWKGVGYLYLMFVVFAVWLVVSVVAQIQFGAFVRTSIQPIVDKWPTLKIHNAQFSIDKPSPYTIDIANGAMLLDFDMRDGAHFPDGKIGILVTKTAVSQVVGEEKQIVSLTDIAHSSATPPADATFEKATIQQFVDGAKAWAGFLLFCCLAPATLIFCIIQTLIYGGIGMIVSSVANIGLTYGQAVRIAAVALTPGLMIEAIARVCGHEIPFWGLISIVLAIIFVVFGVRANLGAEVPPTAVAP